MKVRVEEFKNALLLFEAEFISSMKDNAQKFFSGFGVSEKAREIDAYLAKFVDADGLVDIDRLKSDIDFGMKQCGGEFNLHIDFGPLAFLGVKPANIRISLNDVEKFFKQTLPAVTNVQLPNNQSL